MSLYVHVRLAEGPRVRPKPPVGRSAPSSFKRREIMVILFHFYHNFCPLSSYQTKTFEVAEIIFQFPTFPPGEYTYRYHISPRSLCSLTLVDRIILTFMWFIYRNDNYFHKTNV